jgi:3D-(3,5/4)-trihydroxycyclohexane-1,2-dione acylhydrolase (decyclizing)
MNTQPAWIEGFNLDELPEEGVPKSGAAVGDYLLATQKIRQAGKVLVKVGGGGRYGREELENLLELSGGVLVHTPIASGAIPASNPRNMGVGGSKGSISGNYAMENAELLITVGTRAVCQSDCSRTGYPRVRFVININTDLEDSLHYGKTLALLGDAESTLNQLNEALKSLPKELPPEKGQWLIDCKKQRDAWQAHKAARYDSPVLNDLYWGEPVLTQPAAIKLATDWAKSQGIVTFFDAGDVQANGFQIVEDEGPDQTFTETGASYMGFAVSALLATAVANQKFTGLAVTGDGSFTMNPQILIDGAEHGARGCIFLLDNGRMAAISGLQNDQYSCEFATSNQIKVDYLAWAKGVPGVLALDGGTTPDELQRALSRAGEYDGLSLIRVKVYYGPDPLGGMGVFGRWNVGNWCVDTQALRHEIGL